MNIRREQDLFEDYLESVGMEYDSVSGLTQVFMRSNDYDVFFTDRGIEVESYAPMMGNVEFINADQLIDWFEEQ
jgi:hypothetical protein